MKFFQFQEQKNFVYNCLHINQLSKSPDELRLLKKPYEKYKDMRAAMKLIEKTQNSTEQEQQNQYQSSQTATLKNYQNVNRDYRNFGASRLKVYFKDAASIKYRTYLARSRTIDQFRLLS